MRARVVGSDAASTTTTSEPPTTAKLTRSWGNLSSESHLEVVWGHCGCVWVMKVRGRGGGPFSARCVLRVVGSDADSKTIASERPTTAYLTRSCGDLSSESHLEVWGHCEVCGYEGTEARRRTVFSTRCVVRVVGSDADSNHHFRAANHCVLDTLLGQSTLRITLGGRMEDHY